MFNYNEFFNSSELDYNVETFTVAHPVTGEPSQYTGTMAKGNILGCGFTKYQTIQNREAFKILEGIAEFYPTMQVEKNYVFDNGAKACCQVNLGTHTVGTHDVQEERLTIINSHDGSSPITLSSGMFRMACKNQLHAIHKKSFAKFRHTKGGIIRYEREQIAKVLQQFSEVTSETLGLFKELNERTITKEHILASIAKLILKGTSEATSKRQQTIVMDQTAKVLDRLQSADNGLLRRDSAWNLYNAFQGTFQHDPLREPKDRNESAIIGTTKQLSVEALEVISEVTSGDASEYRDLLVQTEIEEMLGDLIVL